MHSHSSSLHPLPVLQLFLTDLEQLSDLGGRITLRNAAAYAASILDIVAEHVRELPSTMRALADVRSVVENSVGDEVQFRESVEKLRSALEREYPVAIRHEGRAD